MAAGDSMAFAERFATEKNRWYALVIIALALAVIIIDNTVLNVSIPYMIRDLNTDLTSIDWVISGYALTIATVLITVGRLGDLFGRKRLFMLGMLVFAAGSFIGSEATSVATLIFSRGIVQALGAAMSLTSALSLIASNFKGKERAMAFGLWGAIAGASATVGPLLGGYLTAYYSWRWSLRINVFISAVALLGSVFIRESRGEGGRRFDFLGTVLSGLGLFSLVFGFIQGSKYGWLSPKAAFSVLGLTWPFTSISIIPFFFAAAAVLLALFVAWEHHLEATGSHPLLRLSIFGNRGFSAGMVTLGLLALGQFGVFFLLPVYLENVLGINAFQTGLALLPSSISIFIFGSLSGFIASRLNPRIVAVSGMSIMAVGYYLVMNSISPGATVLSLAPALVVYGVGIGLGSAQLTNIILSSAPVSVAGEASAVTTTMRQVGASISVAVISAIFLTSLVSNISQGIQADSSIPDALKGEIIAGLGQADIEGGQLGSVFSSLPPQVAASVTADIDRSFADSTRSAMGLGVVFVVLGALASYFIPNVREEASRG
jgi:EmrB/QacA subfamily drug resistance transporter